MSELIFRFSKRNIYFGFIYALVCVAFGIIINNKFGYVWIGFGLIYLFFNFLKVKNQYIRIDQEKISIFELTKREIRFENIVSIDEKFGDYYINTSNKRYKVHKSIIDKEDLNKFEQYFGNLKELYNNK